MNSGNRHASVSFEHDGDIDDDDVVEHPSDALAEVADQSANSLVETEHALDDDEFDPLSVHDETFTLPWQIGS
jgi:hypothetical protein